MGSVPSRMSFTPLADDWLFVRKPGQVAQPAGMCARSSMTIESTYAFCEEMRTLSRTRAEGSMMDLLPARITNVLFSTEGVPVKWTRMARGTCGRAQENVL